jgi:putative DNA-invertase from lambdoid prophage Rac
MKAAIYARVSTTDQNCEMQLRELRQYCKARGWKLAGEYVDTGWSGAKARRPQFYRLVADARQRKIDGIVVWIACIPRLRWAQSRNDRADRKAWRTARESQ